MGGGDPSKKGPPHGKHGGVGLCPGASASQSPTRAPLARSLSSDEGASQTPGHGLASSPAPGAHSQPMSMTQMEKIFSELVLGETLPKPTLVRLLSVK